MRLRWRHIALLASTLVAGLLIAVPGAGGQPPPAPPIPTPGQRVALGEIVAVPVGPTGQGPPIVVSRSGPPSPDPTTLRVIALTTSQSRIASFQEQGCSVTHRLRAATGLICPTPVSRELVRSGQAVLDQLRQPFDLAADQYVKADQVWPSFTGTGVRVAVLDTGVQADHAELVGSIILTVDFAGGPPQDRDGHGTHVTGIVAGNGVYEITNTYGYPSPNRATGVSPDGGILSGRVCGPTGCWDSTIIAGIEWAIDNSAQVINLSLGGQNFGGHCDSDYLAQQVNAAVDAGVVVVAAAGNDDNGVSSPACASKAIAVGAVYHADIGPRSYIVCTDSSTTPDQRVCFSNTGAALDVMAPGAGVLSTYSCRAPGANCRESLNWYAWMSGTSMSAPHVAGAAALILQADPSLAPAEVKLILESTARDLGAVGRDDLYGWGVIDVEAAVAAATPAVDIALTTGGSVSFGTVALSAAVDSTGDVETVRVLTGPADLYVKSTAFSDGSNLWSLGIANGTDQVVWEFSPDAATSTWAVLEQADTLYPPSQRCGHRRYPGHRVQAHHADGDVFEQRALNDSDGGSGGTMRGEVKPCV
jgi:subtilisin family serine protease